MKRGMTVKELIKVLETMPQNDRVVYYSSEECYTVVTAVEPKKVVAGWLGEKIYNVVVIDDGEDL